MAKKPKEMSDNQRRYLEEYEKYKHIIITPGTYKWKKGETRNTPRSLPEILYVISEIENETAVVITAHSGVSAKKTIHWCRKNLESISQEEFERVLEQIKNYSVQENIHFSKS